MKRFGIFLFCFFCLLMQNAYAALSVEEFKAQYQKLMTELKDAEKNRDKAKEKLEAYIADSSWRKKRNDELFDFLFSDEGKNALQKELNVIMKPNLQDTNVIETLKITKEQLTEVYKKVDVKHALRLALQHGCENKMPLGKATPAFNNFVELTTKYQIQERLDKVHTKVNGTPSLQEIIEKLKNDYILKREMVKKEIANELEKKYRLYKVGDSVTLKTQWGGTINGYIRNISSANIRLSGGNAGGRKILNFSDLDKDELVHFDLDEHKETLKILLNTNYSHWLGEHSFQSYAASTLLEKGFFPYTIFERQSQDKDSKPKPVVAWISCDEFIAAKLVRFLPTHIKEHFEDMNMAFDNELKEYTFVKMKDLKKQFVEIDALCLKDGEKMRIHELTYNKLITMESKGAAGEYEIYMMYLKDNPLGKSSKYAMDYLLRAVNHKYVPALFALANHLRIGDVCSKNIKGAIQIYETLCNNNDYKAMIYMAELYVEEREVRNEKEAIKYCLMALNINSEATCEYMLNKANKGYSIYSFILAKQIIEGKLKLDDMKAITILELAMSQNCLEAKIYLADIYRNGKMGVKQNLRKARDLYGELVKAGVEGAAEIYTVVAQEYEDTFPFTVQVRVYANRNAYLREERGERMPSFDGFSPYTLYINDDEVKKTRAYYHRQDFLISVSKGDKVTATIIEMNKYDGIVEIHKGMWIASSATEPVIICEPSNSVKQITRQR